jgi:starch synthase
MTIHNLPYMGGDATDELSAYGFQPLNNEFLPKWALTQPLPLGLWSADAIVPVSPTYAREILTPDFGCGLDPFLATCTKKLTGILNGLDEKCWNPATDNALSERYNFDTLPTRVANKSTLQKTLELKVDQKVPLLVMIGRIDQQKGLDIACDTLRLMRELDWQFILLGSGDLQLEETARNLQANFPDRVRVIIRYDQALSRQLYGGGDMLLMPSRYEPCGLAQMIAMHYGCVPVVHATGGLKDTVQQGKNGFLFKESTTESMLEGMARALTAYSRPEQWQKIQYNGMKEDFSWSSSARRYASIYNSLVSSS